MINLTYVISESLIVSATAVTALTQPSLAEAVRCHYHRVTLNPASTAPSVRTTRVTTPVNAGQVHEALCRSVGRENDKGFRVFKGDFERSRDTGISIREEKQIEVTVRDEK